MSTVKFLTYPTKDEVRELPVFTDSKFIIEFPTEPLETVEVGGEQFWKHVASMVTTGSCEIAVDPRQAHGLRVNKEMILGMISQYSS